MVINSHLEEIKTHHLNFFYLSHQIITVNIKNKKFKSQEEDKLNSPLPIVQFQKKEQREGVVSPEERGVLAREKEEDGRFCFKKIILSDRIPRLYLNTLRKKVCISIFIPFLF